VINTPCVVLQLDFFATLGSRGGNADNGLELTAYDVAGKARLTTPLNASSLSQAAAEFVAVSTSDTSALIKGLLVRRGLGSPASFFLKGVKFVVSFDQGCCPN
jgi:hypothetical protein